MIYWPSILTQKIKKIFTIYKKFFFTFLLLFIIMFHLAPTPQSLLIINSLHLARLLDNSLRAYCILKKVTLFHLNSMTYIFHSVKVFTLLNPVCETFFTRPVSYINDGHFLFKIRDRISLSKCPFGAMRSRSLFKEGLTPFG